MWIWICYIVVCMGKLYWYHCKCDIFMELCVAYFICQSMFKGKVCMYQCMCVKIGLWIFEFLSMCIGKVEW